VQGADNDKDAEVRHNIIGNDYFRAMQIPLVAGRGFGPLDMATSPKVAVISEYMAHTLFPGGSPIGRHYGTGSQQHANDIEVIGVAKDAKFGDLAEPPVAMDYFPYRQVPGYLRDLSVRYTGDLSAISSAAQKTIHSIDRNLPINHVLTVDEEIALSMHSSTLIAQLSAFFGLLAVFLSSIGIYGLMSYVVSSRTNEIGIRMALGADRRHMRWMVMREISVLVVAGVAIGVPITIAGGHLVASMLFGVRGTDPMNLVEATGLLLSVAALAGYRPARRASRVDPMVALRCE
jgi:predicted permease